jgi:hypothetical protein
MPDGQLDPTSRATFARAIEALHEEFCGIYSLETIERFVDASIDRMSGARVVDFIPCSCTASPESVCVPSPKPKEPS